MRPFMTGCSLSSSQPPFAIVLPLQCTVPHCLGCLVATDVCSGCEASWAMQG